MAVLSQQQTFGLFPVASIHGYDLLAVLSPGPIGTLYRVRHRDTGELAELLLLVGPAAHSATHAKKALWEQTTAEWRRELTSLSALKPHPQIARLLDFGEVEAGFYLLMQPAEGVTVRQLLERKSARSSEWTLVLCAQIASALDFAAEQGFTHGDLNPNNVLLESATNEVRLRYFGLNFLPLHGITAYTSPEQAAGDKADSRSDIYALGALLYAYVSGEPPFAASSSEALARIIQSGPPIPPPDQPEWMQAILAHAMQTDPNARYRYAGEMVTDLRFQRHPAALLPEKSDPPPLEPDLTEPITTDAELPASEIEAEALPLSAKRRNPFARLQRQDEEAADAATSFPNDAAPFSSDVVATPGLWTRLRYLPSQARDLWHAMPRETRLPSGTRFAAAPRANTPVHRLMDMGRMTVISLFLLSLLLSAHAAWLVHAYQRAEVQDRHWYATERVADRTKFLQIGDTLEGPEHPLLTTKKGVEVMLQLVDSHLSLPPNSQLRIKRLGYEDGRIREVELLKGRVRVDVQPETGLPGRYELWCHGIHVWTSSGRFVMTAQSKGAEIRSQDGEVWVSNGKTRWIMSGGQHLTAQVGQLMDIPRPLSLHDRKQLANVFPAVEPPSSLESWYTAYQRAQQKTFMPFVARVFHRFLSDTPN